MLRGPIQLEMDRDGKMKALNGYLDKLVRPEVHLLHRSRPAFQVCGYTGLALAIGLALILAAHLGLSLVVIAAIILAAVLTFFGLVMATKIMTGDELIIYYHHEIAVMIVAALLLRLLRQPVLPYLDVTILGIGVFLVCGRVGCLMVGCCHGRPSHRGVCYRPEHATAGFTPYYVGVRLFPVQAVESLWVLCIALTGIAFVLNDHPPGTALAWYVVMYDLGRFGFEFLRGDPNRPYLWGFSQPQWISLLLMCGVVWAEMVGILPFHLWHAVATACLALAMIAITLRRRFQRTAKFQLLHPRHVREVVEAIELVLDSGDEEPAIGQWTVLPRQTPMSTSVLLGCTSLGIQISASKIAGAAGCIDHFALSSRDGGMTEETARVLSRLILQLRRAAGPGEFLKGNREVFHLLIHPVTKKEIVRS